MMMTKELEIFKVGEQIDALLVLVRRAIEEEMRIDQLERGLFDRLLELGFALLRAFVENAGDGDEGDTIEHNRRSLNRLEKPHMKVYRSIFGVLEIERWVYGTRESQEIEWAPLDAKLGLPAGEQSYVLEDWMQTLTVQVPYERAVAILQHILKIKTSARSAEVMNRRMAEFVDSHRQTQKPPPKGKEGDILVVTVDGKGVPVRKPLEERLREEAGVKRPTRQSTVPYAKATKRRARGGRKSRKQMAYVGAVYSIDRHQRTPEDVLVEIQRKVSQEERPSPLYKRVWAEMTQINEGKVSEGQPRIFSELAREVGTRRKRSQPLVCLMDGQRSLWALKQGYFGTAIGILDVFHVMEWLWKAAYCFHPEGSADAEDFVTRYLRLLLEGKMGYVIGAFRRFVSQKRLKGAKKNMLEKVIGYFESNKKYMQYDAYLDAGYPIGSGVVEGACRHLVKDRMEGSGMRWNAETAEHMIKLRATYLNGDWESFVQHRVQTEQDALYHQAA